MPLPPSAAANTTTSAVNTTAAVNTTTSTTHHQVDDLQGQHPVCALINVLTILLNVTGVVLTCPLWRTVTFDEYRHLSHFALLVQSVCVVIAHVALGASQRQINGSHTTTTTPLFQTPPSPRPRPSTLLAPAIFAPHAPPYRPPPSRNGRSEHDRVNLQYHDGPLYHAVPLELALCRIIRRAW